jgi:cell division protease FtsH
LPPEDKSYTSIVEYKDILARAMGGRIAEELKYGKDRVTTGAGSDLRKATEIARDMVIEQGMGDDLRDQVFHEDNGGMVFDKITHERPYSDATAEKIDKNVKELLEQAAVRARAVLVANTKSLDALAAALLENETLEEEAVAEILKDSTLPKEAALY